MIVLDLNSLTRGVPGLTEAMANVHAECAAVCLDHCEHRVPTELTVHGSLKRYELQPLAVTDRMYRAHFDLQRATEFGACGVAIALVREETGEVPIQISRKGTGFDYWLGKTESPEEDLPFQNSSRLEVSGILRGNDSEFWRRLDEKLEQTSVSDDTCLPAIAVVIEFGSPRAGIKKRYVHTKGN